jgi:hypothetical protein
MTVTCPFCASIFENVSYDITGSVECTTCARPNVKVVLYYDNIHWIDFRVNKFILEPDSSDNTCRIFLSPSEFITLDFCPKLTPDNVEDWMDRFLKMKTFL